jgi:non-ribosomal peptide synthetase component E (peptide arylation enzyme)
LDTATIMAALSATAVALTARWEFRIMSPGWLGLRAAQSCPVIAPQRKSWQCRIPKPRSMKIGQ